MNHLKEIGQRIKILREKLKLTQEELAKRTGYTSKSSINKIEKGEVDLPQSKIEKFARALNTTPAEIMGWGTQNNTTFSKQEIEIIKAYRKADPITKQNIAMILRIGEN